MSQFIRFCDTSRYCCATCLFYACSCTARIKLYTCFRALVLTGKSGVYGLAPLPYLSVVSALAQSGMIVLMLDVIQHAFDSCRLLWIQPGAENMLPSKPPPTNYRTSQLEQDCGRKAYSTSCFVSSEWKRGEPPRSSTQTPEFTINTMIQSCAWLFMYRTNTLHVKWCLESLGLCTLSWVG